MNETNSRAKGVGSLRNSGELARAVLPLLQEALARQESFRWRLRGNSMRPTLPPGCEIEIVPLPARVQLGQILVFASGDALIAHRLVRRSGGLWITQGDGRRGPDPPLRPKQVLGVVLSAWIDGRLIWPGRREFFWRKIWVSRFYLLAPLRAAWLIVQSCQKAVAR